MRHNLITYIFALSFVALMASVACQSAPIERFTGVKPGMSKDEVLEKVGSPVRTERFDGKEKWAYRYYTGDERNIEVLKYVTFVNSKVESLGDDSDEHKRLEDLKQTDIKRAEKRKAVKSKSNAAEAADAKEVGKPKPVISTHVNDSVDQDEVKNPKNIEFVEVKGQRAPIENSEE
ncbi:MAG: outer membrane protein assembly factor BamE [Oligoflexia bacterium]|nr:outer membrane protein assembly factor BamE [Oligoflexia bacterium]